MARSRIDTLVVMAEDYMERQRNITNEEKNKLQSKIGEYLIKENMSYAGKAFFTIFLSRITGVSPKLQSAKKGRYNLIYGIMTSLLKEDRKMAGWIIKKNIGITLEGWYSINRHIKIDKMDVKTAIISEVKAKGPPKKKQIDTKASIKCIPNLDDESYMLSLIYTLQGWHDQLSAQKERIWAGRYSAEVSDALQMKMDEFDALLISLKGENNERDDNTRRNI